MELAIFVSFSIQIVLIIRLLCKLLTAIEGLRGVFGANEVASKINGIEKQITTIHEEWRSNNSANFTNKEYFDASFLEKLGDIEEKLSDMTMKLEEIRDTVGSILEDQEQSPSDD